MKKNEIIKIVIGIAVFFGLILFYASEFERINNTFQVGQLIGWTFLFLLLPAGLVFFILRKRIKTLFEQFMLAIGLLVIVAILSPLLGSGSNRLFGSKTTTFESYKLINLSARSEQGLGLIDSASIKTDGFRINVLTEDGSESLYIRYMESIRRTDDSVSLPMRMGAWGFAYVNEETKR